MAGTQSAPAEPDPVNVPAPTEGEGGDPYTPPVVLPPDDTSVSYPIPDPDYVPPMGAEIIGWPSGESKG